MNEYNNPSLLHAQQDALTHNKNKTIEVNKTT
jgi:hypothetical protein